MNHKNFETVNRPHGSALLNRVKQMWIVEYQQSRVRPHHWQAYQPVVSVPKGRDPWTVDNRRIGPEDGFLTLEDAVAAVEAA